MGGKLLEKYNKAKVILGLAYPYLDITYSPELLFYKEEYNYHLGVVDIFGNKIVPSLADNKYDIDIFYLNKVTVIQVMDTVTGIIKILLYRNKQIKCIYKSKKFKIDRLLNSLIVLEEYNTGYCGKTIINYSGQRLADRIYLNIIEHLPTEDIICVHYLQIDKTKRHTIKRYDIYNQYGKPKMLDIGIEGDLKEKYYMDDGILYSRCTNTVKVRKDGDNIIITRDDFPHPYKIIEA